MARSPIIIPGQRFPGREIFIPRSAAPKFRCTVPTGEGTVCGKPFWDDEMEAFVRHAAVCAREHEATIHEQSPRVKNPALYDKNMWDPEWEDHQRDVGRRMLAEGRVETRPHER